MYAGPVEDGSALNNLVLGLVTFAVAQARSDPSLEIYVVLRGDAAATVGSASAKEASNFDLASIADARLKAATSVVDSLRLEPEALDIAEGVFCDMCVVNALSSWMCDQVWAGTSTHSHMFRGGELESAIRAPLIPDGFGFGRRGASTTFLPDQRIFPSIQFDAGRLQEALGRLGNRNAGVRLTLMDRRERSGLRRDA
jgi:hypothetical protein